MNSPQMFFIICLTFLLLQCKDTSVEDSLPSFAYVEVKSEAPYSTRGSGVIVHSGQDSSTVLTAHHLCVLSSDLVVTNLNMIESNAKVVKLNGVFDICLIQTVTGVGPAVSVASSPPKTGSEVYAMAAPEGFFFRNSLPIGKGYYTGEVRQWQAYRMEASGGMSGGAVLNKKGELIGTISGYIVIPSGEVITLGAKLSDIKDFIKVE